MANVKEIKNRIKSVRDTKKITSAMYLIASTKMRKAKSDLDRTKPYFKALYKEISRVFSCANVSESEYFYSDKNEFDDSNPCAILVVTADKGLAGAYNNNIINLTRDILGRHNNSKLYVVGEYGRQYFSRNHIQYENEFLYTCQNPNMERAREICEEILIPYNNGEVDRIFIVYTDMKNSMSQEATAIQLLPIHVSEFKGKYNEKNDFEYLPNPIDVLNGLIPDYISGYIYSALVDSFCCEQNARMQAMNSANRNADNILLDLYVKYNRVRQAMITQEITEVSAGARAMRKKHKKEAAIK